MPKLDLSNVEKLIAYLRRQGEQCNRQQPIVPVAGSELLKAADTLEQQAAEVLRLRQEVEAAHDAIAGALDDMRDGGLCVDEESKDGLVSTWAAIHGEVTEWQETRATLSEKQP